MVALAAKFASIFLIARFLAPADFGMYGLVAAGVAYATYAAGADFYTYSNRELICTEQDDQGRILRHQAIAHGLVYAVVIPLIVVLFAFGLLPWTVFWWFLALVVVEHFGQELGRLLVALGHAPAAALLLLCRTGLWPLAVVLVMWWQPELRTLAIVLECWVASSVVGVAFAMQVIGRKGLRGWLGATDWAWIRKGFRVAGWFLIGSLALRALFSADRFWMDSTTNPEVLGAYVFHMSIAGALPALMEAGVFAFEYPAMVASYPDMTRSERLRHAARLLLKVGLLSAAYCVLVALILPSALDLVNQPEYGRHSFFLIAGMAAMALYVASLVPHFALYAMRRDREIVIGNILALLFFLGGTICSREFVSPEYAIPTGLCVAFGALLAMKSAALVLPEWTHPQARLASDVQR